MGLWGCDGVTEAQQGSLRRRDSQSQLCLEKAHSQQPRSAATASVTGEACGSDTDGKPIAAAAPGTDGHRHQYCRRVDGAARPALLIQLLESQERQQDGAFSAITSRSTRSTVLDCQGCTHSSARARRVLALEEGARAAVARDAVLAIRIRARASGALEVLVAVVVALNGRLACQIAAASMVLARNGVNNRLALCGVCNWARCCGGRGGSTGLRRCGRCGSSLHISNRPRCILRSSRGSSHANFHRLSDGLFSNTRCYGLCSSASLQWLDDCRFCNNVLSSRCTSGRRAGCGC